jgi:uncharacterized membrane protein YedE/YeeE
VKIVGAFLSGLVFALGLGLAGMLDPQRVLAFLDLAGPHWDPSLMLVLGAAVGVYAIGSPRFTADFPAPSRRLDPNLLTGAALFGVGWGLVGLCPGPALVDLVSGSLDILLFVAAMLAGMALLAVLRNFSRSR